jgi:DNA-binding CsgD family transcriptional regulator
MTRPGEFSKSMITNTPAELNSLEAEIFKKTIQRFPEEAIYIYSFKQNKMIYADGWEEVLGYKDDEINLHEIINITTPEYAPFSNELNDFTIELKKFHKNGDQVPLIVRVGVFKSDNGKVTEIIGRNQINYSIALGKVMRYAAYGPEKSDFEENLNKELFRHFAISSKEKEAVALVSKGYSFKEIAHHFKVSSSAIEKRILPLYKRSNVKSLTHLITFAYENHILP